MPQTPMSMYQCQCINVNVSMSIHQCQCTNVNASMSMYQYQCINVNVNVPMSKLSMSMSMYQCQCINVNVPMSLYKSQSATINHWMSGQPFGSDKINEIWRGGSSGWIKIKLTLCDLTQIKNSFPFEVSFYYKKRDISTCLECLLTNLM